MSSVPPVLALDAAALSSAPSEVELEPDVELEPPELLEECETDVTPGPVDNPDVPPSPYPGGRATTARSARRRTILILAHEARGVTQDGTGRCPEVSETAVTSS